MGALVRCMHQPPAYKPMKMPRIPALIRAGTQRQTQPERSTAQKKPAQGGFFPNSRQGADPSADLSMPFLGRLGCSSEPTAPRYHLGLTFGGGLLPQLALLGELFPGAFALGEVVVVAGIRHELPAFLRAHLPEVKDAVGMADAPDAEVFAAIRALKDRF